MSSAVSGATIFLAPGTRTEYAAGVPFALILHMLRLPNLLHLALHQQYLFGGSAIPPQTQLAGNGCQLRLAPGARERPRSAAGAAATTSRLERRSAAPVGCSTLFGGVWTQPTSTSVRPSCTVP